MSYLERLKIIEQIVNEARSYLDVDLNNGDFDYPKHDEVALELFDHEHIDWLLNYAKEQTKLERQLKEENEELKSAMIKVSNNVGAYPKATVRTYVKSVFDPLLGLEEKK